MANRLKNWGLAIGAFLALAQAPAAHAAVADHGTGIEGDWIDEDLGSIEGLVENVVYQGAKVPASDLIAKSTFQIELIVPEEPDFRVVNCTGILIAKDVVLTAGHCLPQRPGVQMAVKIGKSKSLLAVRIKRHSRYSVKTESDGNQVFQNDLALLRLEKAVPGGVAALLPKAGLALPEGQTVLVAGAGQDGSGTSRLLKTESSAEIAAPSARRGTSTMILKGGQPICHGDSGGPSFLSQKGRLVVVGVHSSGTNTKCVSGRDHAYFGFDTYVPNYADWIRGTLNQLSGEDI